MLLLLTLGCAPPSASHTAPPPPQRTRGAWTATKLLASDASNNSYFGDAVAVAGDVDGDGMVDIAVGAPLAEQAYVYYGTTSGITSADEQLLSMSSAFATRFGNALGAGDFDADGLADLAVSAHEESTSATSAGAAVQYAGSASGLTGASELRPTTNTSQQQFSYDVAGAGDFNGDGYGDVVFSAHGDNSGATKAGAAYAYYGSATGLDTASEQRIVPSDVAVFDSFSFSLSAAGDVNGDGYDDLIGGAAGADPSGAAYVYYGSAAGLDTTSEDRIPPGDPVADASFGFTVSGAGDVNGDGYDDVVVATYDFFSESSVYVYHGSTTGIGTTPALTLTASDQAVGDLFGVSLTAGDVDRDGYSDVVVSSPGHSGGIGAVYVYYGSASGLVAASEDKLTPSGGGFATFGSALDSGDLNGDGIDDLLIGASGDNTAASYAGAVYAYYGSCVDDDKDSVCRLDDCDDDDPAAGLPLDFYADDDGDGYGDLAVVVTACDQPSGTVTDATDCDDTEATAFPGNPEVCDDIDNDCDGSVDNDPLDPQTWHADDDGDGYGDPDSVTTACDQPSGTVADDTDCDDTDPAAYPGAAEVADDGIDQDCDGADAVSPQDTGDTGGGDTGRVEAGECSGLGWSCATTTRWPAGGLVWAGLLALWGRRRVTR